MPDCVHQRVSVTVRTITAASQGGSSAERVSVAEMQWKYSKINVLARLVEILVSRNGDREGAEQEQTAERNGTHFQYCGTETVAELNKSNTPGGAAWNSHIASWGR